MTPTKEQLKQFVNQLNEATKKEVITIEATPVAELPLTSSKFSGLPYVPKGGSLPTDEQGNSFLMLSQINCEELPENSIYPKKGILQFWIIDGDDLYGMDFENPCSNKGKRIIYYPEIVEALSPEQIKEQYVLTEGYTPMNPHQELALTFTSKSEGISINDYRFDTIFSEKWNSYFSQEIDDMWDLPEEISDILWDLIPDAMEHRIGGYPHFNQQDPRDEDSPYTELLLQIDSDVTDIMWGDHSVANFFIKKEDLQKCNFDDVLYNWDCS